MIQLLRWPQTRALCVHGEPNRVCTVVRCCWSKVEYRFTGSTPVENLRQLSHRLWVSPQHGILLPHFYTEIAHICYVSFGIETLVLSQYTTISLNDSLNDIYVLKILNLFIQFQIRIRTFVSVLKLTSSNRSLRFAIRICAIDRSKRFQYSSFRRW